MVERNGRDGAIRGDEMDQNIMINRVSKEKI